MTSLRKNYPDIHVKSPEKSCIIRSHDTSLEKILSFLECIFVELSSGFGAKEYDCGQGNIQKNTIMLHLLYNC